MILEAPKLAKERQPELYELRKTMFAIHLEWLHKDTQLERGKERGREGPELGLQPGKKRERDKGRDGPDFEM